MTSANDCFITFYDIIITLALVSVNKEADSFENVSLNLENHVKKIML